MDATVIIITCNRPIELEKVLRSLEAQKGVSFEVLVFDNSSDDLVSALVRTSFPGVTYCRSTKNVGPCVGRNQCAERAAGEILVFLDDDSIVTDSRTLENVMARMRSDRNLGGLGIAFVEPYEIRNQLTEPLLKSVSTEGLRSFVACAAAIRKTAFAEAGGFRTVVPIMGEERDLAVRLIVRGWRIGYLAGSPIIHLKSPIRSYSKRETYSIISQILFDYWYSPWLVVVPALLIHCWRLLKYRFSWAGAGVRGKAMLSGLRQCWNHRAERSPMSWATYRTYTRLPAHGAESVVLDEKGKTYRAQDMLRALGGGPAGSRISDATSRKHNTIMAMMFTILHATHTWT